MKVLHVISGLRGGGAERAVLSLCVQAKQDTNMAMSVLSLSGSDEIYSDFHNHGIRVFNSSVGKLSRSSSAWHGFQKLRKHRADVYHAHMFHACVVACMLKIARPSSKIVFTLHNNYVPQLHRRIFLFLTRPLRNCDIIFPFMKNKWYQKSNAVAVANGVDIKKFIQSSHEKPAVFTCAFAGRLEHEKNPLFLVELVRKLVPDFQFIIKVAGDGSLKNELIKTIERDKLEQYFRLHGYVEDMPEFLSTSHCLLLPSLWEGMPLVLLESAAAGVPVITTPVGNVPSFLDSSNGFIGTLDRFPSMLADVMNSYGDALVKSRRLTKIVHEQYNLLNSYRQHVQLYLQL